MKLSIIAGLLLYASSALLTAQAEINLENGEKLHRSCAFCHGKWSQGILGGWYPRLAGQSADYIMEQLDKFQKGDRNYHAMMVVSGIMHLNDQDKKDLAQYISDIDLKKELNFNIQFRMGRADTDNGKDIYKDDCKFCHGRQAEGKDSKGTPALRGQYPEYLFRQIQAFKAKRRLHDNDPEDETFKGYKSQDIKDILGFIATLDDK
jgi:cytochrome c553